MTANGFKDLFSNQATDYSKFRPHYPAALFDFLASLCPGHERAWDCGTGSGQAAFELARRFREIVATDPSEKQLSKALPRANIVYRAARAEDSGISAASVDLTTVAQALHWFDLDRFYAEVRRVSHRADSWLAVWCYSLCQITPEVDERVLHFYDKILGKYWEPERRLVDDAYQSVDFPFQEITAPPFSMELEWNLPQLIGYLGTWSVIPTATRALGQNPLETFASEIARAWGPSETLRTVRWPIHLRVGRVSGR